MPFLNTLIDQHLPDAAVKQPLPGSFQGQSPGPDISVVALGLKLKYVGVCVRVNDRHSVFAVAIQEQDLATDRAIIHDNVEGDRAFSGGVSSCLPLPRELGLSRAERRE